MNLGQFTEPKLLVPRLLSEWRDSTISILSQRLESAQRIENATAFTHAVLDHESLVSPVFDKAAFPVARGADVKELSFAMGLSEQGVRWGTEQTPVVHMVVLLAVPPSEGQRFISLVLSLSNLLKDEMAFSVLRRCTQPEEMLTVLSHIRCVRTGPGASLV
jgi:mannitol/fructose-specific phosphotransferase system IIA component (Ntr-type)